VRRDDLVTFQVDGTHGSAVAGLHKCWRSPRDHAAPGVEPRREADHELLRQWQEVPDTRSTTTASSVQWEAFLRHVAEDAPYYPWTLPEGAKGVQLVEAALQSWAERRWIDVPPLEAEAAMTTINLPAAGRHAAALHAARPRRFRARRDPPPLQPHRLFGRARGGRPAGRHRPLAGLRHRLGRTIAYRKRLWSLGLGVAEAMDTAQRGMGLDWPTSLELIRRSLDAARDHARRADGQRLRHRPPGARARDADVDDVIRAYEEQMEAIEALGGRIILMASRALARVARSPADYERVYDRVLSPGARAGDPALAGRHVRPGAGRLLGQRRHMAAMDTALGRHPRPCRKVDGIKISLLDKDQEIAMRRRLPRGVRMYTGDDFNYAELIAGDGIGQRGTAPATRCSASSTPIAPAASAALAALAPATRRASTTSWRRRCRCRATSSGAHALLQDRRGLHGLAERPPGPLRDGRRAAEHALAAAPGRAVPPGRQAGLIEQPDMAVQRMRAAGAARGGRVSGEAAA
jgi:hypothetical protein